ncbi:MAG: hypothetical protein ACYSW3_09055 [Planctomycetota bacterium]
MHYPLLDGSKAVLADALCVVDEVVGLIVQGSSTTTCSDIAADSLSIINERQISCVGRCCHYAALAHEL